MKILSLLLLGFSLILADKPEIAHPDSLSFGTFDWKIPLGTPYRSETNEVVSYMVPDSALPLFSLRIVLEQGYLSEDPSLAGITALHAMTLKNGGSKHYSPEKFEEMLELYALSLSVSVGKSSTIITMSGLSDYFDTAAVLLKDLLRKPDFDEERFIQNKTRIIEQLAHQYDTPSPILNAVWRKTLYPQTTLAQSLTVADVEVLTIKDLKTYHKFMINWAPLSIAAAGAIDQEEITTLITSIFKDKNCDPIPYKPILSAPVHKMVVVHKEGLNQAYIRTGFPAFQRPDKRFYPLSLYNEILGGGGFNSRLVSQVRSDAGLTYSIYSTVESNYRYPGTFNTTLFTKSATVNHAIALTQKIIKETANAPLDKNEIDAKRVQLIESLPSAFRTAKDIAFTYQRNELDGRDATHFVDYAQKLEAISSDSVHTVASTFFATSLITVVVGDTTELFSAPAWEGYLLKDMVDTIITVKEIGSFGQTEPQKSEE